MGTKTITLKAEAYNRLRAARRYPTESFSEVVLRASWPEDTISSREFLAIYNSNGPMLPESALTRIEELRRSDTPPADKWASR
jgi:predicted CopG family antitoxin